MEIDNEVAIEILKTFREAMDTPFTEYRDILLGSLDRAIMALDFIEENYPKTFEDYLNKE